MLPATGYRTDERLCEIDYGHWEGRLWAELPRADPEGYAARKVDTWGWQPVGGESYRMLSQRIALWLAEIQRTAVVASHGGVSKALRGLVLPASRRAAGQGAAPERRQHQLAVISICRPPPEIACDRSARLANCAALERDRS